MQMDRMSQIIKDCDVMTQSVLCTPMELCEVLRVGGGGGVAYLHGWRQGGGSVNTAGRDCLNPEVYLFGGLGKNPLQRYGRRRARAGVHWPRGLRLPCTGAVCPSDAPPRGARRGGTRRGRRLGLSEWDGHHARWPDA